MKARSSKVGDRSRILEQQICPKMQISMSPNNPSDSCMVLSGMKDRPAPTGKCDSKNQIREGSTSLESSKVGNDNSNNSESGCMKNLGSIRKTYHFNFKSNDDDSLSKTVTDNEKEIFEYHKLEMIGQGEISDVFKAINLRTQEPFAIKTFCIPEEEVSVYFNSMVVTIQYIEAEMKHHNMFCKYHSTYLDEDDYSLNVTMDYISNMVQISESVSHSGAWDETNIRKVIVKIMKALRTLQNKDLYHGRLNSSNVYVDATWNIKIVDYGFMNVLRQNNQLTTEEGIRLDIFSLGVMIMEMLNILNDLREKYPSEQKNLFGLDIVDKLKEHYHSQELSVNLVSFLDTCFEGSIELGDLFTHPFVLYDASGNKVSPVSSSRSIRSNKHSDKNGNLNSNQGNSFSSKNSIPGFLRKFLTSCSATSTNRKSESENYYNYNGHSKNSTFNPNFYANKDNIKVDDKNKFSIVSDPYNNELGQYTYYCHEDYNGEKFEYRKSKLIPLNEEGEKCEEEDNDLDSVTTPISSSQMKSEFRDKRFEYGKDRGYAKILMKYKRKTMAQPIIQQLTVLEEASISMEQSIEIKTGESPTHQSDARAKEINEKYGGDKIPIPQFRRQQTDNNMNRFSINEEVHRIEVESHHD